MASASIATRVIGDYNVVKLIGAGAYGQVFLGQHHLTGALVAIKSISHSKLINKKLEENLASEITILQQSRHRNIVALYDVVRTEFDTHLVMEYCAGGEFSTYIKSRKRLSEDVARRFLRQLAAALEFMRAHNLIHRDLKPTNILLMTKNDDNATLKVADFGYARYVDPYGVAETSCGTPLYMAPEVFASEHYDAKVDLWSVGCILYEMVCGKVPFLANTQVTLFKLISETKVLQFPPDVALSEDCQDLLRKLLKKKAIERISFEAFFLHPFLDFRNFERENPFETVVSVPTKAPSVEEEGRLALSEAMNSPLLLPPKNGAKPPSSSSETTPALPVPVPAATPAIPATTTATTTTRSPSERILAMAIQPSNNESESRARSSSGSSTSSSSRDKPKTNVFRGPQLEDEFVMVEREFIENHATADVLSHVGVGLTDANTRPLGKRMDFGSNLQGLGQGTSPPQDGAYVSPSASYSPTGASALSRALATAERTLFGTSPVSEPGRQLARDVLEGLAPADALIAYDESQLMTEIEQATRGALVVMEFAEELRTNPKAAPSDAYVIYVKALKTFSGAFKKARIYWQHHGHHVTRRISDIVKMLEVKYNDCLNKAETLQRDLHSNLSVSTSTLVRNTNRTVELLVDRAKLLASDGAIAEVSSDASTMRFYQHAIILLEVALSQDDLGEKERNYIQLLLDKTKQRLIQHQL